MYRQDWSLKPSGEAIRELLLKTWCTDARGTTDAQGTFTVCGFLGEYMIQVSRPARPNQSTRNSRREAQMLWSSLIEEIAVSIEAERDTVG
jgi:hypothetical protein